MGESGPDSGFCYKDMAHRTITPGKVEIYRRCTPLFE